MESEKYNFFLVALAAALLAASASAPVGRVVQLAERVKHLAAVSHEFEPLQKF
jgi:hypothetical protein